MSKLPEYFDPVCATVNSIVPLPRAGFVATQDPTHLPVLWPVGAIGGGPMPPAHPPTPRMTRPITIAEIRTTVASLARRDGGPLAGGVRRRRDRTRPSPPCACAVGVHRRDDTLGPR